MNHPAAHLRAALFVGASALSLRCAVLIILPTGYPADMHGWMETARHVTEHGLSQAYAPPLQGNLYPPAFFYPLWLTGQLYRTCCSPEFHLQTRALDILMRLGPALADALNAALVCYLASRWTRQCSAVCCGLAYAANPAVLANVAFMGMIGDSYYVLLLLLSILAVLRSATVAAVACISLGVLV